MLSPFTLSVYLAKKYTLILLTLLFGLLALIYLIDMIELLRRASKQDNIPLGVVLKMGLFKLPEVGQVILPFAILFSGIYTFWLLTKQYELAVMRAAGLSVWQFLMPIIFVGMLCGFIHVMLVNPLGALLLSRFEQYETKYLGSQKNIMSVFQDGFWIRERQTKAGEVILNAKKININTWRFETVMGLAFNTEGVLISRLDADNARLQDGFWIFENVHITEPNAESLNRDVYKLATELTQREIEESFANPDTISVWNIPSFIKTLEATGFDSTHLKIQFHYLLSLPLFFISMIILAAAVSFQPPRSNYGFIMIVSGVVIGIGVFSLSSYLQALGSSGKISPYLAAWSPALVTLLLGTSALLIIEDG